jgi:hypothetical protein
VGAQMRGPTAMQGRAMRNPATAGQTKVSQGEECCDGSSKRYIGLRRGESRHGEPQSVMVLSMETDFRSDIGKDCGR